MGRELRDGTLAPAALGTRVSPRSLCQPSTLLPNASSQAAQVILKGKQQVSAWTMDSRAFHLVAVKKL